MFPSLFDPSKEDLDVIEYISRNEKALKKSFNDKRVTLEKTLEVVSAGLQEVQKQKLKPVEYIWNMAGYINTCSLDLAITGEALMFEKDSWKRRYFARMAAVNIYEATHDIPNMTGKKFRSQVQQLPAGQEFLKKLGLTVKKINKFKSDHAAWLKDIRLCCAAHRDQILGEQLRIVFEISPTNVLKKMADFDNLLNELGVVFQSGMQLLPEKSTV